MPFAQSEFERDFADENALEPDSVTRFRGLLTRAADGPGLVVFEMDGARSAEAAAYGAAGRVVLNQSDLLVVVWDGIRESKPGGTEETLRQAIAFHVPLLWIDALAPSHWTLLRSGDDLSGLAANDRYSPAAKPPLNSDGLQMTLAEAVAMVVTAELALPNSDPKDDPSQRDRARRFFQERRPLVNFGCLWKPFRDLIGSSGSGRFRRPELTPPDFVQAICGEWPVVGDPPSKHGQGSLSPAPVASWTNAALRHHYAWADGTADLSADAHRSGFVAGALLAAAAVFFALLPIAAAPYIGKIRSFEVGSIVMELVIVMGLVGLVVGAHNGRWHQRWMEYRLLAELIRHLRFMIPLGGGRPLLRTPAHLKVYGDPSRSWMYWHLRAIARETGISPTSATPSYLQERLDELAAMVGWPFGGQWRFHSDTENRNETTHHRLHRAAVLLFGLTITGTVLHLGLLLASQPIEAWAKQFDGVLVLMSGFLPALGAALASINNQGEFARLAKRSRSMADGFKGFGKEIGALRDPPDPSKGLTLAAVTDVAGRISAMMVDEVMDWRVVVTDLPHSAG